MSQLHHYAETHEVTNQVPPLDGLRAELSYR